MNELRICVCKLFPAKKISRRSHAEIACEQALPGTSGGGGGKSGKIAPESLRAGYVEKAKKCAKACAASHAEVRHAFLPRDAPKVCVGGYTV